MPLLTDNIQELNRKGAKDPREDHVVHLAPGLRRHNNFGEDVVIEGVAVKS